MLLCAGKRGLSVVETEARCFTCVLLSLLGDTRAVMSKAKSSGSFQAIADTFAMN